MALYPLDIAVTRNRHIWFLLATMASRSSGNGDTTREIDVIGNADVTAHIHEYKTDRLAVFVSACWRTGAKLNIGDLRDGNFRTG